MEKGSIAAAKPTFILAALTVAFVAAAGCHKEQAAAPPPPPAVEVTQVVQRDVPIYTQWVGSLDGYVNAVIRPQVSGYLIKQNYTEGDLVKKGQVLFEIDPRPFQSALNQAKAQLAQQQARHDTSKANLARVRPLAAQNAVSKKDLDDSIGAELSTRSSVDGARAAVEQAQLDLDFTRITSPINGVAGIAKAQLGDLVGPSMATELTSVSTLDPIKAYINISEQEYLNARGKGRGRGAERIPLQLVLADGSVYPYPGRLALADRQIDPTTGTLKVGSLFPNPGNMLRPGGYALVRAMMSVRRGALLIPQQAVTDMQGKYLVAVVGAGNKAEIRPVQVAERIGSEWVVTGGLKPGERVVVEGTQKVKPGMTVTPQPYHPQAAAAQGAPAAPAAPVAKR
jgi:membrane fusion protein, multidrug efflux system